MSSQHTTTYPHPNTATRTVGFWRVFRGALLICTVVLFSTAAWYATMLYPAPTGSTIASSLTQNTQPDNTVPEADLAHVALDPDVTPHTIDARVLEQSPTHITLHYTIDTAPSVPSPDSRTTYTRHAYIVARIPSDHTIPSLPPQTAVRAQIRPNIDAQDAAPYVLEELVILES